MKQKIIVNIFAAMLMLLTFSCSGIHNIDVPAQLDWKLPWQEGDTFTLVRKLDLYITPAAFEMNENEWMKPTASSVITTYLGKVLNKDGDLTNMELCVESVTLKSTTSGINQTMEYSKSRGLSGVSDDQIGEVKKKFERIYKVKINKQGCIENYEGQIDMMGDLRGFARDPYSIFTYLLRELPQGPMSDGARWKTNAEIAIAHCGDKIKLDFNCRLKCGVVKDSRGGFGVDAEIRTSENSAQHLSMPEKIIGNGKWWISPDFRYVSGETKFKIEHDGDVIVSWSDSVEVTPGN